jgi:dTDP-4-amino-4,6-dideoxygalactose transaminase
MDVPDTVRHASARVVFEEYPVLGFNYRMTDIQAAIGREQLKRLPVIVATRRALALRYAEALAKVPGVTPPAESEVCRSNWQSYCVRLDEAGEQRRVMQAMLDAGVSTRRGVMCAHREPAYPRSSWSCGVCGDGGGDGGGDGDCDHLRHSEAIQDTGIILPLYHDFSAADQDRVVSALAVAVSG